MGTQKTSGVCCLEAAIDECGRFNPRLLDPRFANVLYHDRAAEDYDEKWSICYDERTLAYAQDRVFKVIPERTVWQRALEVGAGTGFFLLHLHKGGWVIEGSATDISEGILKRCAFNARRIGWQVETQVADAEKLPYEDDEFDLVCGHAFLHHIPDPQLCLAEMVRVCRGGGTVLIAGEPTKGGHAIAGVAKRVTSAVIDLFALTPGGRSWRRQSKSAEERRTDALESVVDIWEFEPARIAAMAQDAGLVNVRYVTEELLSSVFGWFAKTVEGRAPEGVLGARWAWFAYRNYLRLSWIDDKVLSRVLPVRWFYNIVLAGEKPR